MAVEEANAAETAVDAEGLGDEERAALQVVAEKKRQRAKVTLDQAAAQVGVNATNGSQPKQPRTKPTAPPTPPEEMERVRRELQALGRLPETSRSYSQLSSLLKSAKAQVAPHQSISGASSSSSAAALSAPLPKRPPAKKERKKATVKSTAAKGWWEAKFAVEYATWRGSSTRRLIEKRILGEAREDATIAEEARGWDEPFVWSQFKNYKPAA
jgi:hypothetical protein